jgi:hypothetical protein
VISSFSSGNAGMITFKRKAALLPVPPLFTIKRALIGHFIAGAVEKRSKLFASKCNFARFEGPTVVSLSSMTA